MGGRSPLWYEFQNNWLTRGRIYINVITGVMNNSEASKTNSYIKRSGKTYRIQCKHRVQGSSGKG